MVGSGMNCTLRWQAGCNLQYFSLKNRRSMIWDVDETCNLQSAIPIN